MPLPDFYEELIARTGYAVMLESKNTVEDRTRLENVRELLTSINGYLENAGRSPPWRASWMRSPCTPTWTATTQIRTAW